MKFLLSCLLFHTLVFELIAQDSLSSSFFKQRDFGKYIIADHYAPIVKVDVGITYYFEEYDVSSKSRGIVVDCEPTLGAEIPIYYRRNRNWRYSFSIPISFSTWFDFTESRTAPILDTDFRFSAVEFNYNLRLNSHTFRNIGLKVLPFFHESTHLGDELTLVRALDSIPTTRINVSYECFELSFLLNDPFDELKRNHSFKLGAKFLFRPNKGWYNSDPLESDTTVIDPSTKWIEPYFQYQFQNPEGKLSNKRMMFLLSAELSARVKFSYPIYYRDENGQLQQLEFDESYIPCLNVMAGWKFLKSDGKLSRFGAFMRLYAGLNYHGQFRNIPLYPRASVTLVYEN